MEISLSNRRSWLYRKGPGIVILALICSLGWTQVARRRPLSKGPRALGLVEIAGNGRAHLVPITIVIDGRFYDASAYKADPVPMSLDAQTVYEGVKTGVSQGLFTISGALHQQGIWMAIGTWKTNDQIQAEKAKTEAERKVRATPGAEPVAGPPRLKRPGQDNSTPPAKPPSPPAADKPSAPKGGAIGMSPEVEAPDRPVLRRQSSAQPQPAKPEEESQPLEGPVQSIPAISDADGPEPRPYRFEMKPDEEQGFQKKMLAMAGEEVRSRAAQLSGARPRQAPEFHDMQMKAFDVSTTNEAVLVLTAKAKIPAAARDLEYITVLVAREDIYGDLHKLFAETTDDQHLDVAPRYELIDAVDADGDGRAELLFREYWDSGSAFVVYRVAGDRLWPLFEGKPGS